MCINVIKTFILSLALVIGLSVTAVGAVNENAQNNRNMDNPGRDKSEVAHEGHQHKADVSRVIASKLDKAKLKVCQKREASIKKIMTNMQLRSERQMEVFNKIADRTKAFYDKKQRTVENYTDLVSAVDEKRDAAKLAIETSSETIDSFSCESDSPATIKDLFKTQLKDQISALKDYKTTIKDLIVAVKSAQSHSGSSSEHQSGTAGGVIEQ